MATWVDLHFVFVAHKDSVLEVRARLRAFAEAFEGLVAFDCLG